MNSPEHATKDSRNEESTRSSENLAFLYQGLLTIIVRLQAGREHIPEAQSFRARAKKLLLEAESEAKRVGYEADDIKDASLAVIAFLDSVVLHTTESAEAVHAEWVRQSLALDLLQVPNAGEVFFERLDDLRGRRNSQDLADVLEVYALCMLLGFEGRYSERERADWNVTKDRTRRRIDEIRGKPEHLSPAGSLPDAPAAAPVIALPASDPTRRYVLIALAAAVAVIVCFVLLKLDLVWEAEHVSAKLL